MTASASKVSAASGNLQIGWSRVDLTPSQPVMVCGQFYARISEGVDDPVGATVMALTSSQSDGSAVEAVFVACDTGVIPESLTEAVRARLATRSGAPDPQSVILNATHTHCAPELRGVEQDFGIGADCGVAFEGIMEPDAYVAWAAERIADAICEACANRAPAAVGFGLGHATIAYNRRVSYYSGETKMYGGVAKEDFSHLEGGSDTSINVMGVWDAAGKLTGVVVNTACPSQASEHLFTLTSDYWHEARTALQARFGKELFVLPQVSAAGDLVPARPTTVPDYKALAHKWEALGLTQREHIAREITAAVADALQVAEKTVDASPIVAHHVETLALSRYLVTKEDCEDAIAQAAEAKKEYEAQLQELEANPDMKREPRWYKKITATYRRMHWFGRVAGRYESQKDQPKLETECHVLRIGDAAFATNRFEYYLDFGLQIKARSEARQTFIVELAGPGGYLPTARAMAGKSYGAVPASVLVGPQGGKELVDWSVATINAMYAESATATVTGGV